MPDELISRKVQEMIDERITRPAFRDALNAAAGVRPLGASDRDMIEAAITEGLHRWRTVLSLLLRSFSEMYMATGQTQAAAIGSVRALVETALRRLEADSE